MTALPPEVRYLVAHRVALAGAVEPTHPAYVTRVRAGARARWDAAEREHPWTGHRVLRVRQQRERLRMSVADLAELVGMFEVELEMVEAGEAAASAEQLVEIATALFTSVEMLTGKEPWRV